MILLAEIIVVVAMAKIAEMAAVFAMPETAEIAESLHWLQCSQCLKWESRGMESLAISVSLVISLQ